MYTLSLVATIVAMFLRSLFAYSLSEDTGVYVPLHADAESDGA